MEMLSMTDIHLTLDIVRELSKVRLQRFSC